MDLGSLFDRCLDLPEPNQPLDPKTLPSGGGVCALVDEADRVVLTLAAQNLRRVLNHRLSPPAESGGRPRADLRAVTRRIRWTPTHSTFETSLEYLRIARQLNPDGYRRDLAFGPLWFARVNPEGPYPRWVADRFAFTPPVVDVGPFRDRASCRRFIELLEDLFDLCRHHDVLKQAPNGQACAYKEMGKCPAPCDGTIGVDEYRQSIVASVEFARGVTDRHLAQLERAMVSAGRDLHFETAARIRERIDRARKLLAADGRLHNTPEEFRYLVVQRGGGTRRVCPFFVDRGAIYKGETVLLEQIDGAVCEWADNLRSICSHNATVDSVSRSEGLWLVGHFLVKGDRAPGVFAHQTQTAEPNLLAEQVVRKLGKTPHDAMHEANSIDPSSDQPVE